DSVSTVKLLQLANEAGTPIYTINSANINATLPLLNQAQAVKTDIQNVVAAGRVVTIPGSAITRNDWHGSGYMARNPDTGEGAYIISNGSAGGAATLTPAQSALGLLARQYVALAIGKPANQLALNTGLVNYWLGYALDEYMSVNIAGLLIGHGYIPRLENTFSKEQLLNLINLDDNVVIYYSGHGAAPGDYGDALIPGYKANGDPDYVYPQDIHAKNARIIFFNSCNSAHSGSFANAFGATKVFMGWNKSIDYEQSSYFGYAWWNNMLIGKTVLESAQDVMFGLYTNTKILPNNPKIIISLP
ncbi:MAG: hypothetical protein WC156_09830, partial [Pedobacter sp.]